MEFSFLSSLNRLDGVRRSRAGRSARDYIFLLKGAMRMFVFFMNIFAHQVNKMLEVQLRAFRAPFLNNKGNSH